MVQSMIAIFETSVTGTCMPLGVAQASRDFVKRQRFIKPQRFVKGRGFIKGRRFIKRRRFIKGQICAGVWYSQPLI
jgi:hypothetical protein